ncbi:MAG: aldo/keto reductase [Saprospiraceae bacterium]|nr:aldo/keto reductase [Saprospiraceae bacterium]
MKKNKNALDRRKFISLASMATAGISGVALNEVQAKEYTTESKIAATVVPEWRNKVEGMAYRQLGRTGMMVSEVVNGGDPVRSNSFRQVEIAIERGVNYLDMAPAYGNGDCETAYSKVIDSSSKRSKVFMTTKVSGIQGVRDEKYQDIFKGLPSEKQQKIMNRAAEIRAERYVDKPGYFLVYWPNQETSMDKCFISNAMVDDYGHLVDGSKEHQAKIKASVEGSLTRAKTDHFDILMCPHGGNSKEEVSIAETFTTFQELKKEGKVRFLGVSTHNDPAGVLEAAAETGQYDVVMCAYNIVNGGYMEGAIRKAYDHGVGIIAMKVAMAVATHHKSLQPIPGWRVDKVERIVPGDLKAPLKAYLWALQNPKITAVISNLWDEQFISENLSIVGKKVALNYG